MSGTAASLLVDIGNSRLKWALASPGSGLGDIVSLEHDGELPRSLVRSWEALDSPRRLLLSCVASGAITEALAALSRRLWGIEPRQLVATREHAGLVNCYEHPERLGIDRWLAMAGAREMTPGAFCVVDAGTAMTIDVVEPSGRHRGGLILPGLAMMHSSLQAGTAIPDYSEPPAGTLLGCSTVNAIQLGCLQALGSLVDRVVEESGIEEMRLFMTGGDADRVARVIEYPVELVPELVFRGLMSYIEQE